jgi:CDGSH-type Zn-finger protein/uncharacterized Fe-S cluster protein YjdI
MKPVETEDLKIGFDMKTCIHARKCWLGLPKVFDPAQRPWIQPQGVSTEEIVATIEACPSGALSYERRGAPEPPAPVNTARLWENGPVELRGDLRLPGEDPRTRAVLCRCGKTENPPFCDGSHKDGFEATGLPPESESETLEAFDGPIEIKVTEDGPIALKGNIEVIGSDGRRVAQKTKAFLCRCGASKGKPFCDGSHKEAGFKKAPKA